MCKENKMGFLATIPEKCELRFNDGIPRQQLKFETNRL